ncbi:hypothetical protein, partial [Morganella psychrotolerans]
LYGGNNLASMAAFRSGEIRFMCHSAPSGLFFRGGDNYPDTEGMSGFYLRRSSINELVVVNGAINPCDGNNAEKIKNRIMASLKRRTILERKFRDRFDSVSISGLLALFYSNQGNSKDYQREYERRARYEANFEDLMHVVEKLNFPFEVVKNLYSLGYVELADELKLKFISNPDFLKDLEEYKSRLC